MDYQECTYIIVEILIEGKYKNNCEEYLYSLKVHKTPVGIISFLTLGEIVKVILEEIEDSPKRDFVFGKLLEILKPIDYSGFTEQTLKTALELIRLDYKLKNETADAFHLAIAATNGFNRFITLEDKKFGQNLRAYLKAKGTKIVSLAIDKT